MANVSTKNNLFDFKSNVIFFRKKTNYVDPMVFACVSMTAKAVGPKMANKDTIFKDIIDQMLTVGLR